MTAVDTNVLVRLLISDEPVQTAQARELFAHGQVWIAKTVLLETNWVLTRLYGLSESDTCDAFEKLLGLPSVHAEDSQTV